MKIDSVIDSLVFFTKSASQEIDLSNVESFSLSAVMRELNKQCDSDTLKDFLDIYLQLFNQLETADESELEDILNRSLEELSKQVAIKKTASSELANNPELISNHMVNIIRLLVEKIKPENRQKTVASVKAKLSAVDINDVSNKNMPASSAIGQSISFVKQVLFDKDPAFIKTVLSRVVNQL